MKLIELTTVDSTNAYAKELARAGASHGTVVWAHVQTAGRGRQGNEWISAPGNLFMTAILRTTVGVARLGQLSFLSAVALAQTLEGLAPAAQIQLKWPNDLLINGKKAAGILIETEGNGGWVVVGIGLNITSAPPGAVCLRDIGTDCDAETVIGLLMQKLETLVQRWEAEGFGFIRDLWLARAYKRGEGITARLPKETLSGVFTGIDADGALQLQLPDGMLKTINSGEVFL